MAMTEPFKANIFGYQPSLSPPRKYLRALSISVRSWDCGCTSKAARRYGNETVGTTNDSERYASVWARRQYPPPSPQWMVDCPHGRSRRCDVVLDHFRTSLGFGLSLPPELAKCCRPVALASGRNLFSGYYVELDPAHVCAGSLLFLPFVAAPCRYPRASRISRRISLAASGILVPGPKIALTPAFLRKS